MQTICILLQISYDCDFLIYFRSGNIQQFGSLDNGEAPVSSFDRKQSFPLTLELRGWLEWEEGGAGDPWTQLIETTIRCPRRQPLKSSIRRFRPEIFRIPGSSWKASLHSRRSPAGGAGTLLPKECFRQLRNATDGTVGVRPSAYRDSTRRPFRRGKGEGMNALNSAENHKK